MKSLKRVVVVAATNRPDMLDPALLRPGRIDRKIYVSPPDGLSRRQIIEHQLAKMPCDAGLLDETFVTSIVQSTEGFSGAEVVAVFSEAALLAIDEDCERLEERHVEEAVSRTVPQITPDMTAFYENISHTLFKV